MSHKFLALFLITGSASWAQHISIGLKGGIPLTDGLSSFDQVQNQITTHTFSDSKQYIVGPMVEVRLPLSLAVEIDALYRPIDFSTEVTAAPFGTANPDSSRNVATWEFPVLGKYRFAFPVVHPYVEAGPSFRKPFSSLSYLSGRGFTLGGGVEVQILKLRIAPELRYTRWASDGAPIPASIFAPSKQDQAEFLVGFSF